MKTPYNKFLYGGFLLLSAYYIIVGHRYIDAATNMGIALIFDPFNVDQKWEDRPRWQKFWLVAHLAIMAGLFGLGVGVADRLGI